MTFDKYFFFIVVLLQFGCDHNSSLSTNEDSSVSLPIVAEDSLTLVPELGLVLYKDQPFSGTSISYFSNRVKARTIDYLAGKKHGYYRKWFESGQLSFESAYTHGKKHGVTKSWWANGNVRSASNFEHGVAQGLQLQWYKSGAIFKRMQLVDGREDGLQRAWRENGKLYNNYQAKNGRIFGLKRANLCYELDGENIVLE